MRYLPILVCSLLLVSSEALAFCGFYVAKADTKLYNEASKVVIVRDGNKTVLTMVNDYQGDPREFAMVVPVPTFIERDQIHVTEGKFIEHLDAYSSPRLVEYFDRDPCSPIMKKFAMAARARPSATAKMKEDSKKGLGVTVEAEYSVGEYAILILSAEESTGLETWLRQNGYKIPEGAHKVLGSYIKQKMRFFVAKVDLSSEQARKSSYLRPLQVAYETPKFMLPIRLGTVNAKGPQDLFAFVLTRTGRVETTNYRTVKLPSNMEIPVYLKDKTKFSKFYKAMFDEQVRKHNQKAVFIEYAWDMNWCDPCAADPLSRDELRELGVFWVETGRRGPAQNAFVTRMHVRYTGETFPEDLVFQHTGDRSNFQGRYVLQHPWKGNSSCPQVEEYRKNLVVRQTKRAETLAELTGWPLADIKDEMGLASAPAQPAKKWYQKIWD
jgi:hypothetical protein